VYIVIIIIGDEYKFTLVYIQFYVIIFLLLPAMVNFPFVALEWTCF